jgi:hypothetical protein
MKKLKLIHGAGEIKRISKQVRHAFDIINGHDLRKFKLNSNLVNKIEDLGFVWKSSSGISFIGKTQVIKCALITRRPPPPSYRIPTLIYAYEEIRPTQWDWDFVLLIQPKADLSYYDTGDDYRNIMKKFARLSGCDSHSGNIGKYKGQCVLFDW